MFTCLLSWANTTPSAMIGQLSSQGQNMKANLHNFVILIIFCCFLYFHNMVYSVIIPCLTSAWEDTWFLQGLPHK